MIFYLSCKILFHSYNDNNELILVIYFFSSFSGTRTALSISRSLNRRLSNSRPSHGVYCGSSVNQVCEIWMNLRFKEKLDFIISVWLLFSCFQIKNISLKIEQKCKIKLKKMNVYLFNFPREIIILHHTDTLEYKQFLINSDQ